MCAMCSVPSIQCESWTFFIESGYTQGIHTKRSDTRVPDSITSPYINTDYASYYHSDCPFIRTSFQFLRFHQPVLFLLHLPRIGRICPLFNTSKYGCWSKAHRNPSRHNRLNVRNKKNMCPLSPCTNNLKIIVEIFPWKYSAVNGVWRVDVKKQNI